MSSTKFITFLSICGGAGTTTLAMSAALKLVSENKKVCLVIQDREKFEALKDVNLPYSVYFLDKDLAFSPDLFAMIFVLNEPNQKINEMASKTGGVNLVVTEPTQKGRMLLEKFKSQTKSNFNYKVVFNNVLSNRMTHESVFDEEGVELVKNRMIYEDVLFGRDIFSKENSKTTEILKQEIE